MKGLDLSKFSKIGSKNGKTTFKHKDGHYLSISHNSLKPEHRKQIEELPMADGGAVHKALSKEDPGTSVAGAYARSKNIPGTKELAKNEHRRTLADMKAQPSPKLMADGGATPPPPPQPVTPEGISAGFKKATGWADGGALPSVEEAMTPEVSGAPSGADAGDAAYNPPAEDQTISQDVPQNAPTNSGTEEAAATPQAAPVAQQTIDPQEMAQHGIEYAKDLASGAIKPETYESLFAKRDTLGKLGTIFGLLVGGGGAGLAHQPNQLMHMMDQQINNDMEAQKQTKDSARNFLSTAYQHELQQAQAKGIEADANLTNLKAEAQAKIFQNWTAFKHFADAGDKLPPGSHAAQAHQQALAVLFPAINNENFDIASRAKAAAAASGFMGAGDSANPEQDFQNKDTALRVSGNTPLAENMESKHFPGIAGQASVPLAGADREYLSSGTTFQKQLDDFKDWTKKHSGDLSPSDRKEGMARAADLQGAYRQATHGGVYKEGEANFISKLIDSTPTKFFNSIRVTPSLEALSSDNKARVNQYAKNLGFAGTDDKGGSNQASSAPEERFDPKTGKTALFVNKKFTGWK